MLLRHPSAPPGRARSWAAAPRHASCRRLASGSAVPQRSHERRQPLGRLPRQPQQHVPPGVAAAGSGNGAAPAGQLRQSAEQARAAWVASQASANPSLALPISVLTDSYKASHFLQYPEARKMVAYGEFRCGFGGDEADTRLVVFGLRYLLENYVLRPWTEADVEAADAFYRSHLSPAHGPFPFPRELFLKFVRENGGYFPVRIQALPEGSCVHAHVPVYQITAEGEYAALCTFLETLLTMVWYPTTVATLSRRARDVIAAAFDRSVEGGAASPLLASRLHDFGFRGCTSLEQSVLGGCAHLLNFDGTDTMSAAYYAQFHLNGGVPVGMSIPATEHSVMTCWPDEQQAVLNMVQHFGKGIFATVMDSYDYAAALQEVVPAVAPAKTAAGGFWVLRPDSGDPVEVVVQGLRALDTVFGSDTNALGYRVLRGAGVIQGDGINVGTIGSILGAVLAAGYSAESVAFGMGGGLLQRVNRDSMSFATKLSHVVYVDGAAVDVMKHPRTDSSKISLPGELAVKRVGGVPTVFPADSGEVGPGEDLLQVVYDHGPVPSLAWPDFSALRAQVAAEWDALPATAPVLSPSLLAKVERLRADMHKHQEQQAATAAASSSSSSSSSSSNGGSRR